MREHLHRGKTTKKILGGEFDEVWVYGDLVHSGEKIYIHPQSNSFQVDSELSNLVIMHEVISETVGEFTGLTDKNGKKIFEGDILQGTIVSQWVKEKIKCNVIFDRGSFVCIEHTSNSDWQHKVKFAKDIEIVGNIHDNPELLE